MKDSVPSHAKPTSNATPSLTPPDNEWNFLLLVGRAVGHRDGPREDAACRHVWGGVGGGGPGAAAPLI